MGTQRKEKTLNKNYKQNRGYTHGGYSLGRLFCHIHSGAGKRGDVEFTKTKGFNPTWNTGDTGTTGMTFNNRQTLTERTGAFKDRIIREERRDTPGIKLTINMREKLGHREHMGSKNTTKQSRGVTPC